MDLPAPDDEHKRFHITHDENVHDNQTSPTHSLPSPPQYGLRFVFVVITLYVLLLFVGEAFLTRLPRPENFFLGAARYRSSYPGSLWRTSQTKSVVPLLSNSWINIEQHSVQTESGKIIDDWIWMDVIDQVNVLVHLRDRDAFLLFKQNKYGLDKQALAVAGGHIDVARGETPLECAKRELLEEMGLTSDEWVFLGRFRTNVNRGQGYCSMFLAKNSYKASEQPRSDDELESQSLVFLTEQELLNRLLAGEIAEVKWTANVALGLLYIRHYETEKKPSYKYGPN